MLYPWYRTLFPSLSIPPSVPVPPPLSLPPSLSFSLLSLPLSLSLSLSFSLLSLPLSLSLSLYFSLSLPPSVCPSLPPLFLSSPSVCPNPSPSPLSLLSISCDWSMTFSCSVFFHLIFIPLYFFLKSPTLWIEFAQPVQLSVNCIYPESLSI